VTRSTIEDVARAAGVSVATVSRALRSLPNVAPRTAKRVHEAADRLGYKPHTAASWLATGRTSTVGLVAPFFGIWYTGQVMAGVEQVLVAEGYDLLVYAVASPEQRTGFLEQSGTLRTRVDGMLLVDFFVDADQAGLLEKAGLAAVSVGSRIDPFSSLTIDNRDAAARAVGHLLDLGHTAIAVMGEPAEEGPSPIIAARHHGYRDALRAAGIEARGDYVFHAHLSVGGGAAAMERVLAHPNRPTAVFCMSDEMAIGAMGVARLAGVEVPREISLIGFDDHDLAEAVGLSTMRQPAGKMGSEAAVELLALLADPSQTVVHRQFGVDLVVRETTGRPPP
jgi:DNA-binding LacI/PurR family transcriptional regulator